MPSSMAPASSIAQSGSRRTSVTLRLSRLTHFGMWMLTRLLPTQSGRSSHFGQSVDCQDSGTPAASSPVLELEPPA